MAAIAKFVSYDGGIAFSEKALKIQIEDNADILPLDDIKAIGVKRPQDETEGYIAVSTHSGNRYRLYFEDEQLREAIQFKRQFDALTSGPEPEQATPRTGRTNKPRKRKRTGLIAAVIILVLIAAAAVIFGGGEPKSDNPLLDLEVEYWPVKNGTGTETIGKWASITADKAVFQGATSEQFSDFMSNKVKNRDYSWFTVFFADGTGLKLGDTPVIEYGYTNQDGQITETLELYGITETGQYAPVE